MLVSTFPLVDLDPAPQAINVSTLVSKFAGIVSTNTGVYPFATLNFAKDSIRYTNYDRPDLDIAVEPDTQQDVSAL